MNNFDFCLPFISSGININALISKSANELMGELHPDERELLNAFISQGGLVRIQPEDPCDCGSFTVIGGKPVIELYLRDSKIPRGTIVHEMVHYDQWHRGDLVYKDGKRYWKGVVKELNMVNPVNYRFSPWESEAHSIENAWLEKNGFIKSYHARELNQRFSALSNNWIGIGFLISMLYLFVVGVALAVFIFDAIASIPFVLIVVLLTARLPLVISNIAAKRREQS